MKCSTCQKVLREGMDVLEVQEGVIGTRGFVALASTAVFCAVDCLKEFFKASRGYEKAPRRVP